MVRSILVPLDGSSFAEHALPLALTLARKAQAKLSLVHVHVPLAALYTERHPNMESTFDPALRQREQAYLDAVTERVRKAAGMGATPVLVEGPVVETLQAQVQATGADLVVMTTHGRGAFGRFWLGSVADELLHALTVPVLLTRPHGVPGDLAREQPLQHVLIPLDGSPLAEQILEPAVALGALGGATYTLLQVIKPAMPVNIDFVQTPLTAEGEDMLRKLQALHEQQVQATEKYLQQTSKFFTDRGLRVQTRVVTGEQPAAAILEEVNYAGGNLIALATHGRRGLGRLLLGSVADKVVRGSSIPVLVYRPQMK